MPRNKAQSTTKEYFFKGAKHELKNFTYKDQVTIQDCVRQYVATFLSNLSKKRIKKDSRNNGLPDEFGEGIVRLHYPEFVSFKATTGKKGDMYGEIVKSLGEVKTATSSGPTSFSPLSNSDIYFYIFVDMKSSKYEIYEIPYGLMGTAKLDKNTTLAQQWEINENLKKNGAKAPRPRFSMSTFVKNNELKPKFSGRLIEKEKLDSILKKHDDFWKEIEQII